MSKVRVAAAQYNIECFREWDALEGKLASWVAQAAAEGARLVAFPEYAALELAGLVERRAAERRSPARHQLGPLPVPQDRRLEDSLLWVTDAVQPLIARYNSFVATLATR